MSRYLDYRQNIMDPISPTICSAKWYNATIYLWNGTTMSCHHPGVHSIDPKDLVDNPSGIHNTPKKKELRQMMLDGQRPDECNYCWRVEDMGPEHISDRVFQTVRYSNSEAVVQALPTVGSQANVNLKSVELAFSRSCNFACSYCNVNFSTTWAKDIKKHGPYDLISHDYRSAETPDEIGRYENNPYIEAFWKWWPELSTELEEMRVTGGEPLMSDDVWKLFDLYQTENIDHIRLAINSNLCAKPDLIDRLITSSHHVPTLDIYTSCEAVGKQAEFIREGLDYAQWKNNVERIVTEGKVRQLHVMMTINALCLFSLPEFISEWLALKDVYNVENRFGPIGNMSFNILRHPAFQSIHVLPVEMLTERAEALRAVMHKHRNNRRFHDYERETLSRVIEYIDTVRSSAEPHFSQAQLESDFKSFMDQYAERRGLDISVFPQHFVDWYNSLKTIRVIPIQQV